MVGLMGVPSRIFPMLLSVSQCPSRFRAIGLRPPAVQLGKIEASVDQDLHSAGSAGLPRPTRCVEPEIHALHQLFGQNHVVVYQEDHPVGCSRIANEPGPSLYQGFSFRIKRVGFSRDDELDRPDPIVQQFHQPVFVIKEKVGPFIACEASRKANGDGARLQHLPSLSYPFIRYVRGFKLPGKSFPNIMDQLLTPLGAKFPQGLIAHLFKVIFDGVHGADPSLLSARIAPKGICCRRIP